LKLESCKIVFLGGILYSVVQTLFCCRMYRLATMHSVTDKEADRQTDRQTDDITPIADQSHCVTD